MGSPTRTESAIARVPNTRHQRILIWILLVFVVGVIVFKTVETDDYLANFPPVSALLSKKEVSTDDAEIENTSGSSDDNFINISLTKERLQVKEKFRNYTFHPGLNVSSLNELIPEMGGHPAHNLVISTWRSGSTFLGELLTSHPGSFYHYEPLLPYGIHQLRYEPEARPALTDLKKLMNCDYSDMDHFINYGKTHIFLFSHTPQISDACKQYGNKCFDPAFFEAMCKVFPFQQMKVVRTRIRYMEQFLSDKSLRMKILLLVRDPRATLQSRKHREWCPNEPDCYDPAILCGDLLDDYYSAKSISLLFKESFKVIRYEDLSLDIYNKSKDILNFFNMKYHEDVRVFLDSHTKETSGGVSSTFRNSKTAPIHWKYDLTWSEVDVIQQKCNRALNVWGYNMAANESHLKDFNPIGEFCPNDLNIFS